MDKSKHHLLIALIALLQCFIINDVLAQTPPQKLPTQPLSYIADICLTSPFECLENIDQAINSTPKNSRVYFEILQYKFEALFNLQRGQQLYDETKVWMDNAEVPLPFQVTNAIYFAKSAWHIGNVEESRVSYIKAKDLLEKVNNVFPSPLRIVQFANLQMQLKQYSAAYQLLLSLAEKYPNSPDSRFMMELHGNLGHAANQLGKTENALIHWQETHKWSELFGNKQQIAVVLFNMADIHDQLKQYSDAERYFSQAVSYAVKAGDKVKANQARYHQLNVQLKQGDVCLNSSLFGEIEQQFLPTKNIPYDAKVLQEQLLPC